MSTPRANPLTALTCFMALTVVQSAMGLVLLPLYVHALAPTDYGVLALVNVVAALFAAVANLKLDAAMRTHYFDHEHDAAALGRYLRQTFSAALAATALCYAAVLALGAPVFRLVFTHAEVEFFPAGALAVSTAAINGCLAVYFAYLRNRVELRELVKWQLALVVGTIVCQLALVLGFELGLRGVLWGSLLPTAFVLAAVCVSRRGLIGIRLDWRALAPSLKYSLPFVALTVCFVLASRFDRLALERAVDLDVVGAYALMLSVLTLHAIVLGALDNAIRPPLFARLKSAPDRASDVVAYQELYSLVGLIALSVAVFIGSNLELVVHDAGYLALREWLPYGATACVPVILGRYYALLHEFHKRSLDLSVSVAGRLIALLVLLAVLVPPFGVHGALAAMGAADVLATALLRALAARGLALRASLRGVGLQTGVFLAGVWSSFLLVGERSPALAGTLQLVAVAGVLLATNRPALRKLAHRGYAAREPLAG
jgi:O-antigen/teichoic acid export membrane protein